MAVCGSSISTRWLWVGARRSCLIRRVTASSILSMTVVGYTPGRFPRTEVFELPFMMTNPIATSLAF